MNNQKIRLLIVSIVFFCRTAMAEESSVPVEAQKAPSATTSFANVIDPNESFNRTMFGLNAWLVNNIVNPTASFLDSSIPDLGKKAAHNVYENLVEPEFIVTNLFVGDYHASLTSIKRFLINSTLGVAGLWDPAQKMGYQRTETEFTESLCTAGLDPGRFVVLPLIGPASTDSALLLTGFFAVEWYLLAQISPTIATADLVVDLSASAASLRYARDIPTSTTKDPYVMQRADYQNYLWARCSPYLEKRLALHP